MCRALAILNVGRPYALEFISLARSVRVALRVSCRAVQSENFAWCVCVTYAALTIARLVGVLILALCTSAAAF